MSRRNSRRYVSRLAEMQIQRELASEQVKALARLDTVMESLPRNQGRILTLDPAAIPRAVKRAFEAIEAEGVKSNRKKGGATV